MSPQLFSFIWLLLLATRVQEYISYCFTLHGFH